MPDDRFLSSRRQPLDAYVHEYQLSLMADPDMIRYCEGQCRGRIDPSAPPPKPQLIQVAQWEYIPLLEDGLGGAYGEETLPEPISFVVDGKKGIKISDAYNERFGGLYGADEVVARASSGNTITYYIMLPFHDPFESEWDAHRRRKRGGRLPLALKTIATQVAQTVGMCLETHGGSWDDAVAGEVMIDDLFLLELRWVSENTWQPVLAVYRY